MLDKKWQAMNSDEIMQAVVVCDTFEDEFLPMTKDIPLVLLPLINKPLIDYTLESLALGGVDEVFLFCCTHADAIKAHIKNSIEQGTGWSLTIKVKIIVSESCRTYGDCLRDLDAKGILRGYFILVDPGTVSNVSLQPILKKHKELTNKDKGAAMTLVYQSVEVGNLGRYPTEEIVIAYDADSKKLMYHKKKELGIKEVISLPMEFLLQNPVTRVARLKDTHVAICSPAALHLFTDNFDFQTKEDFIKGLLINEEIDGNTIYCHVVQNTQFGNAVTNWRNYQALTKELLNNCAHPIKPSLVGNQDTFDKDVVVAKETILPKDTKLVKSVIGKNVKIGKNVRIKNAIVMDDTTIGDSVVIKDSIIGPSCSMGSECSVTGGSVLGKGIVIDSGKSIETRFLQATKPHFCDNKNILGEKAYVVQYEEDEDDDGNVVEKHRVKLLVAGEESEPEPVEGFSDVEEDEDSRASSALPEDDVKLFFTEVIDSLTRGFEEKLPCDNMILEVNSSRYAYNVTVKEVSFNVAKAILQLSLKLPTGPQYFQLFVRLLSYFSPILKHYIRNEEAMGDALEAIEEVSTANEEVATDKWVTFVLKYFYEKDFISEDAVMKWYEALEETSKLRVHVKPFTDWLQEAEEESSDSD